MTDFPQALKNKIIVALDMPCQQEARQIIEATADSVGFYKVGMGFLSCDGIKFAETLVKEGHKIFLDLKLFDIGQTITYAVERLADSGVHIMTVHGDPYVVEAAAKGKQLSGRKDLDIYAVTVLTSLDETDVKNAGYIHPPFELAQIRAKNAAASGADGVISSGHECAAIKALKQNLKVITPGIRSNNISTDDQKRVMTPLEAVTAGADHLVIGREITKSSDPKHTASSILKTLL